MSRELFCRALMIIWLERALENFGCFYWSHETKKGRGTFLFYFIFKKDSWEPSFISWSFDLYFCRSRISQWPTFSCLILISRTHFETFYKMMQKAGFKMEMKAWTQGSSQARITVESAKPFLAIMSFEWYSKPIVCFSEEHKVVNQKRTKKIQDNINLKGDIIFKVSEEINTIHLLILIVNSTVWF